MVTIGAPAEVAHIQPIFRSELDRIDRVVGIEGRTLTEEQRTRLLEIANRCPVHRTLSSELDIRTSALESE